MIGVCGDIAAEKATSPATLKNALLDSLFTLSPEEFERRANVLIRFSS